jgi:hypothetical protein
MLQQRLVSMCYELLMSLVLPCLHTVLARKTQQKRGNLRTVLRVPKYQLDMSITVPQYNF